MSKENKISPGFKSSPIGPVPGDWEVKRLGTLVEIVSGVSPSFFNLNIVGKYPYLKVEDLNNCEKYQVKSREYSNDEKSLVPTNSIIFPKRGAAILNNKVRINSVVAQMDSNLMAIYPKSKELSYEYLYYQITFEQLYKIADTSTIPQINNKHIIPYSFPIPPVSEQTVIATCLSTWDRAINNCQLIIDNCQLRKKWLMQQLLTGKKRLPGFGGEWKEVRMGDVTTNFSRRNKDLVDAKVYSVTNTNGFVLQSDHFEREIAGDDLSNYKIIRKNEFAYNPARINVGSLAYFEDEMGVISSLYVCFSTKRDILDYYLLQFLQLDHTKHRIGSLGEGGVRIYLWYDLFAKIKIKLPSIEEQTAIAQVLQAADKEINLLKTKLDKLKEQKRGLMQVLLTGRKRLNTRILKQTSLDYHQSSF